MSEAMPPAAPPAKIPIGWALYLGVSWTWVIGMLFPSLLLRDYAIFGFLTFAIPNVIGATAVGWVISQSRAKQILTEHAAAVGVFGIATLAFHAFVAAWLLMPLLGPQSLVVLVLTIGMALGLARRFGDRGLWIGALLGWGLSIGLGLWGVRQPEANLTMPVALSPSQADALFAFAPAAALGFLASPYLDATFLQTRAALDQREAKQAFGIGFGLIFLSLILFSLAYAPLIQPMFAGNPATESMSRTWRWVLTLHIPVQMGLTMAWHGRTLLAQNRRGMNLGLVLACGLAVALGLACTFVKTEQGQTHWLLPHMSQLEGPSAGMPPPEWIYRAFLLLYGTVFPAYVILYLWPTRRPVRPVIKRILLVFCILVTYPLSFLVFVNGHLLLILPCAFVLLAARVAVVLGQESESPKTP